MQEELSPEPQPHMEPQQQNAIPEPVRLEPQENIADSTMQAITHLALNGKDEKSTQWLKDNPYWGALTDTKHKEPDWQNYQIGHELSTKFGDGTPFSILFNMRDTEQDEAKRQELDAKIMGCNTAEAKRLLGSIIKERINQKYDEQQEALQLCLMQQNAAEMRQRAQDSPFLKSVIEGEPQEQTPQQRTASILEEVVNYGTDFAPPEQILHLQNAGLFKVAMGVHEALEAYKENPDDENTQGTVGAILRNTGNMALAMPMFQQAILPFEQKRYEKEGRKSLIEKGIDTIAGLANVLDTQEDTRNQTAAYKVATEILGKSSMEDIIQVASHYGDDKNLVAQSISGMRQQLESGDLANQGGTWNNTYYALAAAIDIISWLNPAGAAASFGKMARETEAQSNAELMSDDYELSDSERLQSRWKAAYTAGATAGAMALTAGVTSHLVKSANALLPSTAVNAFTGVQASRLGSFALNTASTGLTFATIFPAAQGTINAILDTTVDPRIRTGLQELDSLAQNLSDSNYWVQQLEIGSILGFMHSGQLSAKAKQRLREDTKARLIGLTERQIAETTNMPEGKREEMRAIYAAENIKNDKENTILRSIDSIKQNAKLYLQAQRKRDNATIAACHQCGFDIQPTEKKGTVRLYYDGKVDKDGNFNLGEKFIEMKEPDANAYVNGVVGHGIQEAARALRTAEANKRILDAAKNLQGKVTLETLRSPEIVSRVQDRAKAAEQRKKERAQKLMDEAKEKGETLDREKAEAKAGKEVHNDIAKGETLDDIISFGEQMKERMDIDKARGTDTSNTASRAYVVSRSNMDSNAVERIFKIATNATTREVVEEYGEQLRKDWMDAQEISTLQAYRMLADLQSHFGDKANFLTLSKRNATIHEKATDTRFDEDSFNGMERRALNQEVTEALSKLLMSDLLQQVQSGKTAIPAWARTLFDGSNLVETEMQNELALGSALAQARQEGWMPELMKNLLGVAPDAVAKALEAKAAPEPQEYRNAYMDALQRQFELDARYGAGRTTDPELIEQEYNTAMEGQRAADEQAAAREAEAAQPAAEIVKEVEQEQGLSHEEAVKATADSYNAEQETRTAENPAANQDSAFSNGVCMEITDTKGGLLCKFGTIAVDNLKIMPNFKLGADVDTGVVRDKNLTGDYRPDHDPIRVFRSKDGALWVISGRHRLAKCKEAGVDKISVYLYDESPALNMEWAHKFDIESNIRDDQASVMECALYTRGKLYKGGHELTEQEAAQAGLTRKETKAFIGYEIGKYASGSLIDAIRSGVKGADGEHREIDPKEAHRIALVAPGNEQAQLLALDLLAAGQSWTTIHKSMLRELRRQAIASNGGAQQLDMFGMLDTAESRLYDAFFSDYEIKKVKSINEELSYLNQVAGGGSVKRNAKYDVNVKSPEDLKARITELKVLKDQWKSADLYPELKAEVDQAFYNQGNLFSAETKARIDARKAEAEKQPAAKDNPGQSTFDFSTTAGLKESENPVDDLGKIGARFAGPLNRNLQFTGFKAVDERMARMQEAIARHLDQMNAVGNLEKTDAAFKLFAEASTIIDSVTPLLPDKYRFSLEPYRTFFNVYAMLNKTGRPQDAADAVPMDGWDERMLSSFVKSFKRLYKNRDLMREGFWNDVPNAEAVIAKLDALPKSTSMKKAMQTEAGIELFKAIGNMRAQRLMQHYLERVQKQLDSYRKDATLGRILRAVASLKPATKQGKPVKGKISPEDLRKVNDRVRLLQLTRGQQQDVMERYAKEDESGISEWDKLPDTAEIKVRTFNEEGEEITVTTSKQDFELYSCFDAMDAAEADAAARALGSFIQSGKDYWEVVNDMARKRIEEVCNPMIDAAAPHFQNNVRAESRKRNRLLRKKGQRLRQWVVSLMNDVQFMHAIAKEGNIGQMFARFERDMAHAHVLMEQGEMDTHAEINRVYTEITGSDKKKDWAAFTDDINAIRETSIRLKPQTPDFERRETETLRAQLLTRLNFVTTRKQNFDPDVVAKAISDLNAKASLIPAEVLEEVNAKYGSIGSVEAYQAKLEKAKGAQKQALQDAVDDVLGTDRFSHLKNFNKAVKDRAAKQREKWFETHSLMPESEPLDLSKNIAAYRVLIWEQTQYQDSMRHQGYTEETIQQLRDFAGEKVMQFAYKLRESLNARTDDVAAVYEQIYGMPFPKVDNYFRAFFHTGKKDNASTALESDAGNAANAGSLSILKHRVQHAAPIDPLMSVTQAFSNGRKQQDTLIAYSTPDYYLPKELNALINYRKKGSVAEPTMRDVLDEYLGSSDLSILEEHVKAMTQLSAQADAITADVGRWFSLMSNTSAVNILNWRVGSLIKQATAVFNSVGSDSVTLTEWTASMTRAIFGRAKLTQAQMAERAPLRVRNKGFRYSGTMAMFNANEDVVSGHGATSSRINSGMYAMEWLDAKANIVSSRVLYDAVYRKLQKQNPSWSPEILDAAAMEAVEISLANKSQPLDFRSRSALSLKRDFYRTASLFLGGETINTIGRVFSLASRGQYGKAAALWLYQGAALQALTFIWNFLTDDKEQWQKRSIAGYLAGSVFGPLSGVPFLGDIVGGSVELIKEQTGATWLPYMNQSEILPYINFGRLYREGKKSLKSGDALDIAIFADSLLRDISTATAMAAHNPSTKTTAGLKALSLAAAAGANIVDFLLRTYRAQSEEGLVTRAKNSPTSLLTTTPPKKKSTRRTTLKRRPSRPKPSTP